MAPPIQQRNVGATVLAQMIRWDETWHRLREWTGGQGPSERLAAQVLRAEGYRDINPSHPLGGRDGGKDALVTKDGDPWIMAVYFPRGQQSFGDILRKFLDDHEGVAATRASGMAFVTNQELSLAERKRLERAVNTLVEIFHLERVSGILDQPDMHSVREQFLQILESKAPPVAEARRFRDILAAAPPTPGAPDHWMVYDGMLLLKVVVMPAPAGIRHHAAADPRDALERATRQAAIVAADWPDEISLLTHRLRKGWRPMAAHRWGAGVTFEDPEALTRHRSAAASFDTRSTALTVNCTWPTSIYNEIGQLAYHAAREPEVVAEFLVSLRLAAALLDPLPTLRNVDVAVTIAAAPAGKALVSSERAVSGGRFGEPYGGLPQPVAAEVDTHFSDSASFDLEDLRDPYKAAEYLVLPWVVTFRSDNLLARLCETP